MKEAEIIMAYSDFTLKKVKAEFQLKTVESVSLFDEVPEAEISSYLATTLARNVQLALSINTEKARSERDHYQHFGGSKGDAGGKHQSFFRD